MRLIDADKTAEVLTKLLYETALNNSGEASMMCADIAEHRLKTWVDLVPTEAEPIKHGQWRADEMSYTVGETWCSVCRTQYYIDDLYNVGENDLPNYCPHCGAKMDANPEEGKE